MSYCSKKNKRLWREMQKDWKEEIVCKIPWNEFSKYNFKDNNEWSLGDCEQSPLCQMIWGEIISDFLTNKDKEKYNYLINRYYLIVKNDKERYRFLFDVMNNGKLCYDINEQGYDYHFIGNFTPIHANNIKRKRSLQFIHKDFNEDWNKIIKYINQNWNDFDMKFSFEDYIKITLQEDYYSNDKFSKISIKELIKNRGETIQKKCEELFKNS